MKKDHTMEHAAKVKSDYYVAQCAEHHRISKTFSGRGCLKHTKHLLQMSQDLGATTALDYGCGKALQYKLPREQDGGKSLEERLGYVVTKYDPAVPEYSARPTGQFDFVWCTDVLEHVPEEAMDWVIDDLFAFTRKGLFVTVGSYPAKKQLPNGENAHVCIKPAEWWRMKFAAHAATSAQVGNDVRLDLFVE